MDIEPSFEKNKSIVSKQPHINVASHAYLEDWEGFYQSQKKREPRAAVGKKHVNIPN